jgi:hypothetical protein
VLAASAPYGTIASSGQSLSVQAVPLDIGMVADGPDAELISLCERIVTLEAARRTILDAQHTIEDEDRTEPELAAVCDEQEAVFKRITALPEPVTLAGATAMARAAISQAPLEADGSISFMGDAEWLAFGVAEFLVGEQNRQGRPVA